MTDSKKKRNNSVLVFIVAITIFAVFGYLNFFKHVDNIKKNKCNSFARVTKYEFLAKSSKGYYYEFYHDNKTYTGFYNHGTNNLPIINKTLPIVFDCNNPDNNALLVLPKDFVRYNENFPENQNWLKQYDE